MYAGRPFHRTNLNLSLFLTLLGQSPSRNPNENKTDISCIYLMSAMFVRSLQLVSARLEGLGGLTRGLSSLVRDWGARLNEMRKEKRKRKGSPFAWKRLSELVCVTFFTVWRCIKKSARGRIRDGRQVSSQQLGPARETKKERCAWGWQRTAFPILSKR